MIQPILLASRRSCHGWGNDYYQRGNHSFKFTLTSTTKEDSKAIQKVDAANMPFVTKTISTTKEAKLSSAECFFGMNQDNVVVSALKKCEDDNSLVFRCYEVEGRDVELQLNSYFNLDKIEKVSMIENALEGRVEQPLPIPARNIETYKIKWS